jgi:hypothetical protein
MAIIRSPKPEIHHVSLKQYVIYEIEISLKISYINHENGPKLTKKEHMFLGKK